MPATTKDRFRERIELYFETCALDITCSLRSKGYSLHCHDGTPCARLRPIGENDDVEVLWWSEDRNAWRELGEFGMTMPLDDALDYVVDDPMGLLYRRSQRMDSARLMMDNALAEFGTLMVGRTVVSCVFAGICGGLMHGAMAGAGGSAVGALIALAYRALFRHTRPDLRSVVICLVVSLPVGVLGGSVNAWLSGGFLGCAAGMITGLICTLCAFGASNAMRLISFIAVLLLFVPHFDQFAGDTWRLLVPALTALAVSQLFAAYVDGHNRAVRPFVDSYIQQLHDNQISRSGNATL